MPGWPWIPTLLGGGHPSSTRTQGTPVPGKASQRLGCGSPLLVACRSAAPATATQQREGDEGRGGRRQGQPVRPMLGGKLAELSADQLEAGTVLSGRPRSGTALRRDLGQGVSSHCTSAPRLLSSDDTAPLSHRSGLKVCEALKQHSPGSHKNSLSRQIHLGSPRAPAQLPWLQPIYAVTEAMQSESAPRSAEGIASAWELRQRPAEWEPGGATAAQGSVGTKGNRLVSWPPQSFTPEQSTLC